MSSNRIRIGVINWDAALPGESYFGGYVLNSIGNEKYRDRLPFYAKEENGSFAFPVRSQEDYDRELTYAIEGGIDFFAYCWYPSGDHGQEMPLQELNHALKHYQSSTLKSKIGMSAIVFGEYTYPASDFEEMMDAMKQSYYETVDGRPLVFLFGGYHKEFLDKFRSIAAKHGLNPFVALLVSGKKLKNEEEIRKEDAVSAYGCGPSAETFGELIEKCNKENELRLNYGVPVIPALTMGWNPNPRIDHPCPWITYPEAPYADLPTADEVEQSFRALAQFIEKNEQANTNLALAFAWNEFEEGGYLCPTLNSDGTVNDRLIKYFAQARKRVFG